jgi:hypothetical protein
MAVNGVVKARHLRRVILGVVADLRMDERAPREALATRFAAIGISRD